MEIATMGKILVKVRITNLGDWLNSKQALLGPEQVRSIEVEDAIVDPSAEFISLPKRMIQKLDLDNVATRTMTTAAGDVVCKIYYAARIEIQGRECTLHVREVPDTCPVLVGNLALGAMDFVVDPIKQQVIGNPAHGGKEMIELY